MTTISVKLFAKLFTASVECKGEYKETASEHLDILCHYLPSGSGIDSGMKFLSDKSKKDRLVFQCDFHHMNEVGYYDGWTNHEVIITPSFAGYDIRITGKDRNMIKDYLYEVMSCTFTD